MSKAKLSQIKTTWINEEESQKKEIKNKQTSTTVTEDRPKKQQTFTLEEDAISRLWMHRAKTGKTISDTLNDLVIKHIPEYK